MFRNARTFGEERARTYWETADQAYKFHALSKTSDLADAVYDSGDASLGRGEVVFSYRKRDAGARWLEPESVVRIANPSDPFGTLMSVSEEELRGIAEALDPRHADTMQDLLALCVPPAPQRELAFEVVLADNTAGRATNADERETLAADFAEYRDGRSARGYGSSVVGMCVLQPVGGYEPTRSFWSTMYRVVGPEIFGENEFKEYAHENGVDFSEATLDAMEAQENAGEEEEEEERPRAREPMDVVRDALHALREDREHSREWAQGVADLQRRFETVRFREAPSRAEMWPDDFRVEFIDPHGPFAIVYDAGRARPEAFIASFSDIERAYVQSDPSGADLGVFLERLGGVMHAREGAAAAAAGRGTAGTPRI